MTDTMLCTNFRVAYRWRCTIAVSLAGVIFVCSPEAHVLAMRWAYPLRLSAPELADFRRGRNIFIAQIRCAIGVDPGNCTVSFARPDLDATPCPN
jgi:hypothetical protein